MDKDNRDDFTFAKLEDLKLQVTFRMCVGSMLRSVCLAERILDHS